MQHCRASLFVLAARALVGAFLLLAGVVLSLRAAAAEPAADRPRLVVLTDIGGDPDDQQSMIRLMTYANEFEIEGLIASATGTPGESKEEVTRPEIGRASCRERV